MNINAVKKPTLIPDLPVQGKGNPCPVKEGCVTHGFLQTDLSELPHAAVEQSLQGLLPLLKSCDPLRLQPAVLAVLNIYAAADRRNENIVLIRSHTFHRKAPRTDTIMTLYLNYRRWVILLLVVHLTCLKYDWYIRNILVWF